MRIMRFLRILVCFFASLMVPSYGQADQRVVVDDRSPAWVLKSVDGTTLNPFADTKTRAIVLIFVSVDCPIANAYHPRLKEIDRAYRERGVAFFLVHSTANITADAVRDHATEFDLSIPIILDDDQELARRVDAKVTPEAFLLQPGEEPVIYRGAIDNLYAGYGKKRGRANQHYLQDALEQWLSGDKVAVAATKPVGCFISYSQN